MSDVDCFSIFAADVKLAKIHKVYLLSASDWQFLRQIFCSITGANLTTRIMTMRRKKYSTGKIFSGTTISDI